MMRSQFRVERKDVIRRKGVGTNGAPLQPWMYTAEARRLQAEAIAEGVHRVWTNARRIITAAIGRGGPRPAQLVRRSILEPYAHRRRRRMAIAQLQALDDRLLADIGLRRNEIELAVDGRLPPRGDRLARRAQRRSPPGERRYELPQAA
jgi:uncharacterized protein YjiS (DUF1127 family)